MNTLSKITIASVGVIVGVSAITVPVFAQGGNRYMRGASTQTHTTQAAQQATTSTLSSSEQKTLSYMLEEEYLLLK